MQTNGLFIIGVPRSGTTLLRIMLNSHPNLAVGPECPWIAGSYGNLTSFQDLYNSLTNDRLSPIHNFEGVDEKTINNALGKAISSILMGYAKAKGKKRWLEKTPNHITDIPFLMELFPSSKYIHIIRDGRDVACSSSSREVNQRKLGKFLSNKKERVINTQLNALRRWCEWIIQFEEWKKEYNLEVCQIFYEELVTKPRQVLEQILDFIEEPWSDSLLDYAEQNHDLPSWEAGSQDVSKQSKISNRSIGQWKNKFSHTECLISASFADSVLLKFGYKKSL